MMKIVNLFIIILFLFNALLADEKKIKIAIATDMIPYSFVNEDGPNGILVDYWKLWAQKTNQQIEFVPLPWKETLEAIKNKELDIHSGLFEDNKRKEYINYLKPIYISQANIYVNRNSKNQIKSLEDLTNKTIGLQNGAFYESYIKANYPELKIKKYDTFQERFKAIKNQEIDLFIDDSLITWFQLLNDFNFKEVSALPNFELSKWFYAGIKLDDKELEKLVIKGMDSISTDEIVKIEKKWIMEDSLRFFEKKSKLDILTNEERTWLNNNQNIFLAVDKNWDRYSFYNSFGEMSGFHIDLLKAINKNLNTDIKYKAFDSWSLAYEAAKNAEVSGIFGLSWLQEREKYFNYTSSYNFSPYYIIAKKNSDIKSLDDFNDKTAVTFRNSITNSIIKSQAPKTKIINVNTVDEILVSLQKNIADVAIIENAKTVNLEKYGLEIVDSVFTKHGELSIGVTKNSNILYGILEKGINSISKEELNNLKSKWLNEKELFTKEELNYIKKAPVLKVGIENWASIMNLDEKNHLGGIAGELVEKAFEISGLKFEYLGGTWNELLNDFKEHKIDILPSTIFTDERTGYGQFSDKYLSIKNYLYVKSTNDTIKSFENLKNKNLAIQKGFGTIEFVKKNFPEINIIETNDLDDSIQRVLNDDVDALFELQISVENKMKENLITNLRSISQNSIDPQSLHIFIEQNNPMLLSILNKSLNLIPNEEKNRIISKWINTLDIKKEVNVALGLSLEPYVIDKDFIRGIEYDLVNKILNLSSININSTRILPADKLKNILKNDSSLDVMISSEVDKNDGLFYSNKLLDLEYVAISVANKNLDIKNIDDLKGKRVLAFDGSSEILDVDFNKLINIPNKPNLYQEYTSIEELIKTFLNQDIDVLIIEKNAFKWYFNKLSNEEIKDYVFYDIFPNKISHYVAFKDKTLRDIFNKNLKLFKYTTSYEEVFNDYTEGFVEIKIKIDALISSVVSKYIFTNDIDKLEQVIDIFKTLFYIEKIEVFNNENKLLLSSSNKELKNYSIQDSYHIIENIPQKVGYIKVYFDKSSLSTYNINSNFIPSFNLFENFEDFAYVKNIYKQFSYLDKSISFSREERLFIEKNPIITFSAKDWAPLSINENGNFSGLSNDYLKKIEEKTGLEFRYINYPKELDIFDEFRENKLDLISIPTDLVKKTGWISSEFANFSLVGVTNKNGSFISDFNDLKDKKVAIPKNYTSINYIKEKFDKKNIIETNDVKEALTLVSNGTAYAFIGDIAVATFYIKNNFPDLKIVGISDYKFGLHFLIQNSKPELLSIINKVLETIPFKEKEDIKDKWIQTKVSTAVDYSIIYNMIIGFIIILLIISFFLNKLSNAKIELTQKTKDLEEQKNIFETLFNDTSDGLLLIKDGIFIECNLSALKMLEYKSKDEFLNLKPYELSPLFQPDGEKSKEKAAKILADCYKFGTARFEWVHIKSTGENFWVEVVLTKIILNHENVVHVVWRDISDKKMLEEQNIKRNNELEKANSELEVSINHLKQTQEQLIESEKMASLGGLVAGVAHEINTPIGIGLTGITHFVEISNHLKELYNKDEMSQNDFEEFLKTSQELASLINTNLNRAANLVKSFKQVAVDQTSEEKRKFDLKEYINEILSSIHSITKKTKLDIVVSCENNIKINSYPGSLSQILTNLIMNSIIHAYKKDEKGTLNINVTKKDDEIELIYKDDGKGIPPENLNKIFDPFFTTNRENGGSGLGLNIIYNIVTTKLNGRIKCKNNQKGIEFIITFKV